MSSSLVDLDAAVDEHLAVQPSSSASEPGTSAPPAHAMPQASGQSPPAGGPPNGTTAPPGPSGGGAPAADLGVASGWWQGVQSSVQNLTHPQPSEQPRSTAQEAAATARAVQGVVGSVMGALSVPGDMLNAGFANLTAPIAKIFPSLPAATITMLYVGMPHTHAHPPSLIPPAPPIPLPSLGSVMLGTSVKVLINSMPAARCGDIGVAPTCCGFAPFFQIKTGSSNVFIGGNRAARMLDVCQVCATADSRNSGTISAGKIMGAIGAVARGIQTVQKGMGYAAIAMDGAEAAVEDDAAMQVGKAMAAAMAAAQMAADAAAAALSKAMGTDPAVVSPRSMGAIVIGHPNVLIGGFPMVNIPNPAEMLLKRLSRYKRTPAPKRPPKNCPTGDCP